MTKVVAAGEVELEEILEDLKGNDEVVILRDGRAVARVVAIPVPKNPMTREELAKSMRIVGDIMTSEWDER
jgi:antitoxin (DNA-binding transcriptional repressor) of toxin-antitoxin stability system